MPFFTIPLVTLERLLTRVLIAQERFFPDRVFKHVLNLVNGDFILGPRIFFRQAGFFQKAGQLADQVFVNLSFRGFAHEVSF